MQMRIRKHIRQGFHKNGCHKAPVW